MSSKQRGGPTGAEVRSGQPQDTPPTREDCSRGPPAGEPARRPPKCPQGKKPETAWPRRGLSSPRQSHSPRLRLHPSPSSPSDVKPTEVTRGQLQTLLLKNKTGSDTEPELVRNADEKTREAEARGFSHRDKPHGEKCQVGEEWKPRADSGSDREKLTFRS